MQIVLGIGRYYNKLLRLHVCGNGRHHACALPIQEANTDDITLAHLGSDYIQRCVSDRESV